VEEAGGGVNEYNPVLDDGMPRFTLAQANKLLPKVISLTEQAIEDLHEARDRMESEELFNEDDARQSYEVQVGLTLERWAKNVRVLGAYPKGYFTVDFKSVMPDTLFCWTYGEKEIRHTHKLLENFKHRRVIEHPEVYAFSFSLN
jgi:hypothetical protein